MANSTPSLNNEQWCAIPGYECLYSASDYGRIRDEITRNRYLAGRIRIGNPNSDGYLRLSLTINGARKKWFVHDLVAMAFLGLPPMGYEVNHIDGVKTNNRIDNLEYKTHAENMEHAQANGLWDPGAQIGAKNVNSKLNHDLVQQIRAEYATGLTSYPKLARKYGVAQYAIQQVVKRQTWKHVE